MPRIYFTRVSNKNSGITNQIFTLVHSILFSMSQGHHTVVVDSFQRDFDDSNNRINISELLNLKETNQFLEKYNIKLYCSSDFNYKLNAIFYGYGNNVIDITNKTNYISKGSYNKIAGDPCPGIPKELFINYEINGKEYSDLYKENHPYDIWVNGTPSYEYVFKWIPKDNRILFEDILKNLTFQTKIDNQPFLQEKIVNKGINVVHLRLEDDAIQHWSKENNMNQTEFKNVLEDKYIDLICKYIDSSQKTIIVGCKNNKKIIDFLKTFNYDFIMYNNNFNGREINAIFDLIQASQCNETFISNFNYENLNGSTFSYYISLLSKPKKIVSIDLDNLI
jgi:hypothetical protein